MQRKPVESSNITAIGYDPETETLEVEFKNKSVYAYDGVPADVHKALMAAESHGKYLNAEVKGRFEFRQLS